LGATASDRREAAKKMRAAEVGVDAHRLQMPLND
jgi:hypothetical protein